MINQDITTLKEHFKSNEAVCNKVIGTFSLISNKIRFRILCLLTRGDFCVNEIIDIIDCGKLSNVSQQLKLLALSGILEKRRDEKKVIYHLKDQAIKDLIQYLETIYLQEEEI